MYFWMFPKITDLVCVKHVQLYLILSKGSLFTCNIKMKKYIVLALVYLYRVFFIISKFIYLFWEREKERVCMCERGRGRERGRERIPRRFLTVSAEPHVGLELTNSEIMTWAEIKSWMLTRLSPHRSPTCEEFISSSSCTVDENATLYNHCGK